MKEKAFITRQSQQMKKRTKNLINQQRLLKGDCFNCFCKTCVQYDLGQNKCLFPITKAKNSLSVGLT